MSIHRNIKLLTWFNFFSDFKLYAPFAIVYFSQVSGSFALGTSIFSIAFISSSIFEVPTGILSDYIGRKKTLILGTISAIAFIFCYATAQNYWILLVGAILEGLSRSFYSGNNEALLHDSLKEKDLEGKYHHYLGKLSSFLHIGLSVSALIGSLVASIHIVAIFWASLVSQFICLILALQISEPKVKGKEVSGNIYNHLIESIQYFIKNPSLRLLSLSSIFSFGFGEASYHFRPLFITSVWPTWALGLYSFLSQGGAALGFSISGKLMDKFGGLRTLFLGSIFNRFVDFVALIFPTPASPLIMTTTSLHFGIASTVKGTLLQKEFTPHQRATMGSLNSFAGSILYSIIFFLVGLLADRLNPTQALLILEVFLLINIYLYWKLIGIILPKR